MQDVLEELKEVWSADDQEKRNEAQARVLADQFVADPQNDDFVSELRTMTVVEICEKIDVFRAAGMENEVLKIEAYLLHAYEPQTIGTPPEPARRKVEGE